MKPPIFVRTLSKQERQELEAGLRSSDAFVLRRCQILLASSRGEHPPRIAKILAAARKLYATPSTTSTSGASMHSTRAPRAPRRSTPPSTRAPRALMGDPAPDPGIRQREHVLDPCDSCQVSFEEGLTQRRVSGETIRASLLRLGVRWQRAKRWIESPDPEYERKKGVEIG